MPIAFPHVEPWAARGMLWVAAGLLFLAAMLWVWDQHKIKATPASKYFATATGVGGVAIAHLQGDLHMAPPAPRFDDADRAWVLDELSRLQNKPIIVMIRRTPHSEEIARVIEAVLTAHGRLISLAYWEGQSLPRHIVIKDREENIEIYVDASLKR